MYLFVRLRPISWACSKIELTNQHGEAMSIPAEDSAALMEGMMLHRSALACVAHTRQSAAPALGKKQQFPVTAAAEEKKGKGREEEFLNDASPLKAGTDPESSTQRGREESKGLAPEDGGQEERKGNADGNDAQGGIGASSGSLGNVEPKQKGKGKGKMRLGESCRVSASGAGRRGKYFHACERVSLFERCLAQGKGSLRQSRVLRSPGRRTPIARTFTFAFASCCMVTFSTPPPPPCHFCPER